MNGLELYDSQDPRALRDNFRRVYEWAKAAIEAIDALQSSPGGGGGSDNLGNHLATQNLDMGGFSIINVNATDGVDVSSHAARHVSGGADTIANFNSTTSGLVPASGGGTTNFLRADGSFAAPASGGAPTGATYVTMTTDVTLTDERRLQAEPGVLSLTDGGAGGDVTIGVGTNSIGYDKFRQVGANALVGNPTSVNPATCTDIAISANTVLGRKGGDIVSETIATAQIGDDQVTLAKLSNAPAASILLGRRSGSTGDWEPVEIGNGLSITTGAVLEADDAVGARSYDASAFTLATGQFAIFAEELIVSSTNEIGIEGDATLALY